MKRLQRMKAHGVLLLAVIAMASPSGASVLYIGEVEGDITAIETLQGAILDSFTAPDGSDVGGLTFSGSGSLYIGTGSTITEIDLASNLVLDSFSTPNGFAVGGLAFSPSGTLYIGETNGVVSEVLEGNCCGDVVISHGVDPTGFSRP